MKPTFNPNRGQASLVLVLILGFAAIVSILAASSVSVTSVQIEAATESSWEAWYAAWGGVDELMYRLRSQQDFGSDPYQVSLSFSNGATVSATISGDNNQKTVTASGYAGGAVRSLEVLVASSSSKASFIFAAQAGEGGFEMEGNSEVRGADSVDGNVYSNGDVLGKSNTTGNSGSRIFGSVWAVGTIGALSPGSGPYIQKNASADTLTACRVDGRITAPLPEPSNSNCPHASYTTGNAPPPVPLASVDADYWKDQAAAGGTIPGPCTINGTASDCLGGSGILGNVKITGDLTIESDVTINGPVWVEGNFTIDQGNEIRADESLGRDSAVLVASDLSDPANKGRIETRQNVNYFLNSQGAGLIFISENTGLLCTAAPAVSLGANTTTVVLVAEDGCINIGSFSVITGVLGNKVHVSANSKVQYDPSLAQAIISTESGGWAVTSIREF